MAFKSLPPIAKNVIIIFAILLFSIIIYFIYKKIKKNGETADSKKVVVGVSQEIAKLEKVGQVPSYPQSRYEQVANLVEKNLDGCESYESEINTIKEIISLVKNELDFLKLVVAFGVRNISDCGSFGLIKTPYDLVTLVKEQLDTAGYFNFNIYGKKYSGFESESFNILSKFLNELNIKF